jgi:hypothetical protein
VSPSSTDFYSIIIPSLLQRTRAAAAAAAATAARDQVDTSKTRATCECKFITFPFAADTVLSLFLSCRLDGKMSSSCDLFAGTKECSSGVTTVVCVVVSVDNWQKFRPQNSKGAD